MRLLVLLGICGLMFAPIAMAQSEAPMVNVRIESPESTLFDDAVSSEACTVSDTTGSEHMYGEGTAICAFAAAAAEAELSYEIQAFDFGLLIQSISGVPNNNDMNWIYWVNDRPATVGVTDTMLTQDDTLLFAFVSWTDLPLRLELQPVTDEEAARQAYVSSYNIDEDAFQPVSGATVHVGSASGVTGSEGTVKLLPTVAGTYTVYAEKEAHVRSAVETFTVDVGAASESDEEASDAVLVLEADDAQVVTEAGYSNTQVIVLWGSVIGLVIIGLLVLLKR